MPYECNPKVTFTFSDKIIKLIKLILSKQTLHRWTTPHLKLIKYILQHKNAQQNLFILIFYMRSDCYLKKYI